jgi:hypothetical protein
MPGATMPTRILQRRIPLSSTGTCDTLPQRSSLKIVPTGELLHRYFVVFFGKPELLKL